MICLFCQSNKEPLMLIYHILCLKKSDYLMCDRCQLKFKKIGHPRCMDCFKEGIEGLCKDCIEWKRKGLSVENESIYQYNEAMKDYFKRYKFQGDIELCNLFSSDIKIVLKKYCQKGYVLVPIPISKDRYQERGFNQVEELLKAASMPYNNLLGKKDRFDDKQSSKNRKKRLAAKQPFYLICRNIPSQKIVIVDDIYTTGSTLQNAKKLLVQHGAKEVKTVTLAR